MAAAFFQGMLGAFTPYTAFSSDGGARASRDGRWGGGNSYPPGHGGNPGGVQPTSGARDTAARGERISSFYGSASGANSASGMNNSASSQQVVPRKDFKSSET
jgi:hypothetical protein